MSPRARIEQAGRRARPTPGGPSGLATSPAVPSARRSPPPAAPATSGAPPATYSHNGDNTLVGRTIAGATTRLRPEPPMRHRGSRERPGLVVGPGPAGPPSAPPPVPALGTATSPPRGYPAAPASCSTTPATSPPARTTTSWAAVSRMYAVRSRYIFHGVSNAIACSSEVKDAGTGTALR